MTEYVDENLEHQMQIKMLGNDSIYVTCNCIMRVITPIVRNPMKRRGRHERKQMNEMASLGDFPVGTPTHELRKAYDAHILQDPHKENNDV